MMKKPSFSETAAEIVKPQTSANQIDSLPNLDSLCCIKESPLVPLYSESLLSPVNDEKDFVNFDDMEDDVTDQAALDFTKETKNEKVDMMMMLNYDEILNPFKMSKFEVFKDWSFANTTIVNGNANNQGLKFRSISDQRYEDPEKCDLELSQNSVFNSSQNIPHSLSSSLELISMRDIKIHARSAKIQFYDSYFTLFNEARKTMKSINISSIETMKYSSSASSGMLDIFARKKFFYSEDHWKEQKQIKCSRVSKSLPDKFSNTSNSRILLFPPEEEEDHHIPKKQKKESNLVAEGDQELSVTEGINVSFQLGRSHINFKGEEEQEIPILLTIKDNNCWSLDINYTKDVCVILGLQSIDVEQLEHAFIEIGKNLDRNDRLSVVMMDDEEFLIKMCQADCEILQFVRNLITLKKPQKRKGKNLNVFSCLFKTIELLSERRYQSNFTSIIILTDIIYNKKLSNRIGHRVIDKFLMLLERENLLNDSRFSIYAIGYGDNNFNILGEICYDCRGEFYHIKNSSELVGVLQLVCHQAFSKKYFDISFIIEKPKSDANIQITIPNTFVKEIQKGRIFHLKIPNLIRGEEKHIVILAKILGGFRNSDGNHILPLFTVYCQAKRHESEITMKKRHSETIFVEIAPLCVQVMRSNSNKMSQMSTIVYLHYLRVILSKLLEKFTMFYLREEFEVADGIFKENKEFNKIIHVLDTHISRMRLYDKFFYDYLKEILRTVMGIGKSRKYSNLSSNYLLIITHTLFSEVPSGLLKESGSD